MLETNTKKNTHSQVQLQRRPRLFFSSCQKSHVYEIDQLLRMANHLTEKAILPEEKSV